MREERLPGLMREAVADKRLIICQLQPCIFIDSQYTATINYLFFYYLLWLIVEKLPFSGALSTVS
jgi:hypothetical protein